MAVKLKEALGVQEAMDNLAAIAEIDMESPPPLGILKKTRIVTSEEEFPRGTVEWLSGEGSEVVLDLLDATYRGIRNHLQDLYQNPETNWESEKMKKGVAAMMTLVGESAPKLDRYLAYRMDRPLKTKISEREEYRTLQQFYTKKFIKKFPEGIEEEEEDESAPLFDETKSSLRDFESIRKDREYELFYIRNEEGAPYFHPDLFRNLKLTVDFEGESFEEDPLLKIRAMNDRDLQASARQILGECYPAIDDFLKISPKFPESEIVKLLSMAILALFLASDPRHLIQNTEKKSSLEYFNDFHQFLRRCLRTTEYQKWIAYTPDPSDKSSLRFLSLTHLLCRSFFCRIGGIRQEAVGLIHRAARKGEELSKKKNSFKGEEIWSQILFEDENLRTLMAKFPNGPFFKILDLIREGEEEDRIIPFDPIAQGNLPTHLYEIQYEEKEIEVLRIASPTRQAFINKAEVIDEFRGFLRSFSKNESHLIIHFQDHTSWKEIARVQAIESLPKNAEFSHQIHVLTLPKDTDFYYQNNEYVHLSDADAFFDALRAQLLSPEENGFLFDKKLLPFIDNLIPAIHQHFFDKKKSLSRQNREDFIEIFYQFLILKAIEHFNPTSISFTCKDAIDTGAASGACFYGFLSLMTDHFSSTEEYDFFRHLLYAPALLIRERAIDVERFTRTITALERLDAEFIKNRKAIFKTFSELYKELKNIKIKPL